MAGSPAPERSGGRSYRADVAVPRAQKSQLTGARLRVRRMCDAGKTPCKGGSQGQQEAQQGPLGLGAGAGGPARTRGGRFLRGGSRHSRCAYPLVTAEQQKRAPHTVRF